MQPTLQIHWRFTVIMAAFVIATLFVTSIAMSAEEYRTWTSSGGQYKIEAMLLEVKDDTVLLKRQDNGKAISVGIEKLSPEDQAYLRQIADNPTMIVKVLVICHDPKIPSEGNKHLSEVFRWNNPRELAELCRSEIEKYSHGRVKLEFAEWIDVDGIPPRMDGKTYTLDQYVKNRRTDSGWHDTDGQLDYYKVMTMHNVPERINSGEIDEVWCLGDHFFGIWEASMMGPNAFFINGGVYTGIDTDIPFAVMGGNYERNVDCMLENLLHRTENHISRAYGGWNIKEPKTNWDRFTANIEQSPLTPAVGTCHYSPNSTTDYDWWNERYVDSTAEDWLKYPNLTGKTTRINCEAWRETGWHQWWLMHLPKVPGVNPDGRQNNWWKYIYDHNNYDANTGTPRPIRAMCNLNSLRFDQKNNRLLLRVAYLSPKFIDVESVRKGSVYAVWNETRTDATLVKTSDHRNNTRIVAEYAIPLPKDASFQGKIIFGIDENQICDLADKFVPGSELASFDLEIADGQVFQTSPLDLNEMIRRGDVKVQAYQSDMGNLHDLLNLGGDMLMRSKQINPATVQIEFAQPTTILGIRFVHSHADAGRFRLEAADTPNDLKNNRGSYAEIFPWRATSQNDSGEISGENIVMFDKPLQTRQMRLAVERLSGDDYVHLHGLRLFSRLPLGN